MAEYPQPATIVVADMEDSASLTDMAKREARRATYDWLERTLGPEWPACSHEDRGDGVLMLWPQTVPKAVVLTAVLRMAFTAPPAGRNGPVRPRLRVAAHAGEVFHDGRGFVGRSVDTTFRLNESALLKAALHQATGPVAYMISDALHESVVAYGYEGIDAAGFHPATVATKNTPLRAWLHVPGEDWLAARLAASPGGPEPAPEHGGAGTAAPPQPGGVNLAFGDNARFTGDIAGRDIIQRGRKPRGKGHGD